MAEQGKHILGVNMHRKIVAVVGATGDVGKIVAEKLEQRGYGVRRISRSNGISMDDVPALTEVFRGSDGAFVMMPFDMAAPDLHKREKELARKLASALAAGKVSRVVSLSAGSAHLKNHTGSSRGAGIMEERLDSTGISELTHLRAGFFMENFAKGMNFAVQAESGVYGTAFKPDRPLQLIAARDVGLVAAEILASESFNQPRVRELHGARSYTMKEAARILAAAYGNPTIKYVQTSYENTKKNMLALGVSESFADAVVETARSFNNDDIWMREERSQTNTTPTTFETYAKKLFPNKKG